MSVAIDLLRCKNPKFDLVGTLRLRNFRLGFFKYNKPCISREVSVAPKFQTLILLNLILGPVCEALLYESLISKRLERDFGSIPYWLRKLVMTILSPLLATVEEIWRASIFFSKALSLRASGRVKLVKKLVSDYLQSKIRRHLF